MRSTDVQQLEEPAQSAQCFICPSVRLTMSSGVYSAHPPHAQSLIPERRSWLHCYEQASGHLVSELNDAYQHMTCLLADISYMRAIARPQNGQGNIQVDVIGRIRMKVMGTCELLP